MPARSKGDNPHLLVMTATPIPRSLQLTVFGDLDVSVMDEMPAGRLPIQTRIVYPFERHTVYELIEEQVQAGHQAFIIYPLVEQGENEEIRAAVEEQQRLQAEAFPHLRVGLVHGRMKPADKDAVMLAFRNKEYDILVSTSVVEVGVDVPNATMMVIEGANRFGLAQLHQFRGRVGRGDAQSFCSLIPDSDSAAENERLIVMSQTNDGFVLAEKTSNSADRATLGTRQAGFVDLKMANLADVRLIQKHGLSPSKCWRKTRIWKLKKTRRSNALLKISGRPRTAMRRELMTKVVFPGTFDPIHYGHMDIARRAALVR